MESKEQGGERRGSIRIYMCVCVGVCVLVTQLCPTLCDPMDCSPPGSSLHGIFQARILEWAAIPVSSPSKYSSMWDIYF